MSIVTILLIAIGLAMDSLAVSVSGGIFMKKFCIHQSLKIATIMGLFQGGMTILGWLLGRNFSSYITNIDHWIAFILLSYLGGKMIYDSFKTDDEGVSSLSNRTILTLGIATSIDALAVGVSFAFLRTDIWLSSAIIALVTFLLSLTGVCCGSRFGKINGINIELIGGLILVAIGIKILVEHTL